LHDAELLRAAEAGEPFGALRASAAQLEACAILAELTGGERRVWDALRELERAHAHALTEEDAYRSGRRGAGELEDGEALALARASEPSARVAVVVLGALAHDERPVEPLLRSLDRYDEARRLAGALRTWKDDLAARRPTLVLARLARAGGGDPRALAARLYAGGIALDVLALAERACGDAQRALGAVAGVELWTSTVRQLAQRIAAYRGALAPAANAAVAT
ncbi:MAG TPA: hypothetical protein VK665_06135, partial [Candidatus Elarobacter sp.]|nr:hypothetical protein [Candidatus Elarobacter sp.]